jgi:TonB dependent receptor-like, beta-barrel
VLLLAIGIAGRVAPDVQAQETAGLIHIRLAGGADAPGPPASVRIESPQMPQRVWTASVNGAGEATVSGLPPATYHVTVSASGLPAAAADVHVDPATVVNLEARLRPAAQGGSHLETWDRARLGEGIDFTARQLRDLPSADVWGLVETADPFVIEDRMSGGGLDVGRSARVGTRGASWTTARLAFGDVDIRHPDQFGRLAMLPDAGAAEAVTVTHGLAPVEAASPGVAVSLVPRRPGPARAGAIDVGVTAGSMVAHDAPATAPSIGRLDSLARAGLQLGGPLGAHLGGMLSASFTRLRQEDRGVVLDPASRVATAFGIVTDRLGPASELRITAASQRASRPYEASDQFRTPGAAEDDTFWQSQATWDRFTTGGVHEVVSAGYQRAVFSPQIADATGGAVDRVLDGVMPPPPSHVVTGQWQLRGEIQPHDVAAFGGSHALRAGFELDHLSATADVGALPVVGELVDGLPARVWVNQTPVAASSGRTITDAAFYAADRVTLRPNLTLDLGLRAGIVSGRARGAVTGISWRTLDPRISARWNPGVITVFGGYARYHSRLPLDDLLWGDPGQPWANVYRWTDANRNGLVDPGETGSLVAVAGSGAPVGSIDPALGAPSTDELVLGVERRLSRSMTIRGSIIGRRDHTLVGLVNTGAPLSSYTVAYVPDQGGDYLSPSDDQMLAVYDRLPASFGQDHLVLTNPAGAQASYQGAEVTWTLTTASWDVRVGATAYRSRGTGGNPGFRVTENDQSVIGQSFADPNAAPYDQSRLFFDRAYVLKWTTSYAAPRDWHVAVAARYQDGQPFGRLVVAPNLAQGPEIIQAYWSGRTRFTFTLTVDARIEKRLVVAGHRAAVTLDIYNLPNVRKEVEEDVVTGATFRNTTAVQPPRTLRLTFRIEF